MNNKSRMNYLFEIVFCLLAIFVAVRALVFIFMFVARGVSSKQGFLFQMI